MVFTQNVNAPNTSEGDPQPHQTLNVQAIVTMNGSANGKLEQLPEEMFRVIKTSSQTLGPRLGRIALPGRQLIETPHYLGDTSRGVVPHIAQDTFRRDTHISGVYCALEDCKLHSPTTPAPGPAQADRLAHTVFV